ncbi:hypothetical protein GCM10011392_12690 [Wenxinia marina]|nr:hypothetical protein GCM10011392_12690 [Wenxinia marina]
MNTVLPARLRPVTPSRITVSEKGCVTASVTLSTLRVRPSVRRERTKVRRSFGSVRGNIGGGGAGV